MRSALALLLLTLTVHAGEPKTFRSEFQAARKAAEEQDPVAYLAHMEEAMGLEHDRLGRPFYQYHLARAQAMNGRTAEALATLEVIWNERIEGPMIVLADTDPAFASLRATAEWQTVRRLPDTLAMRVTPAGGTVVEIEGAGCTLAASTGADGILLVDSGYPRTAPALLRALRERTGGAPRVRWIVNTHGHYDHAASNHEAGPGAVVIAHPAAIAELRDGSEFVPGHRIPPVAAEALPTLLTGGDITLRFNGENVRIVALPAHTKGDLVVWFEGSRVLHMGDNYFGDTTTMIYPGPDPAAFYATLGPLLAAIPDDAVVLNGHTPRVPASTLKATVARSEDLFHFVRDAIAAGKGDETILEEAEARGIPRRWAAFYTGVLRKPVNAPGS